MAELKIGPPPMPNRKKFPFVGTARVHGLVIDIENLKGSVREGPGWKTKMNFHYGEFRKTKGSDGDKLDVYVGPKPESKRVFVVHQNFPVTHPKAGKYDEDKVMLGFDSPEAAKKGYLSQYSRKDFFRSMTEMTMTQFKKLIFGEAKGEKVAADDHPKHTLSNKLRRFAKTRKKDRKPSAFIRGSLKQAYAGGVKLALGQALTKGLMPVSALAVAKPAPFGESAKPVKPATLEKGAPAASSEGTSSGAINT